jgi:invasion protein IalB
MDSSRRNNQESHSMKNVNAYNAYLVSSGVALIALFQVAAMAQQPAPRPAQPRPQAQQAPLAQSAPVAQPTPSTSPAAQPTQATPAIQSNAPQRTTATYDDWIVQCDTQAGPPSRKLCEMTQVTQLQVQGKSQPFSRGVVPRPAKDQPVMLIIQLPVNVTFSTSVRIQVTDADQGLAAPFARCVPDGCFAEFELKEDTLKKFRSAAAAGKFSFADSSGRVISIPLSFNGFAKAYDALMKE